MELELIRTIISGILEIPFEQILESSRLCEDLGANSLELASILTEAERRTGLDLNACRVTGITTVGDAADRVARAFSGADY